MNSNKLDSLQVLMMPDYRQDNLYQSLLAKSLESQQVRVDFPQGYRRILPMFRAIKSQPYDVLHLHWLTPYIKGENWTTKLIYSLKLIVDLWLVSLFGIKVVWTVHNQISHNCQFPKLELWLRKILVRLVDKIIVHDNSTVDRLEQDWQADTSKIEVIPHGHYREAYKKAIAQLEARKELNLPSTGRIYLNLGMLRPYKGIESLLQIWHENQDTFSQHTLLIVGKPLNKEYGDKLAELVRQIPNVILLPEFIVNEQIHLFYSAADVIVLPFEKILTSGSLILAMSYGKPIIAPKMGGVGETLNEANNLLYDTVDSNGLLNALKKSTRIDLDKLRQQITQSCDRLNWNSIASKTKKVYQVHRSFQFVKYRSSTKNVIS